MSDDIVTTLKSERAELERNVSGAQARIAQLTIAIDALEGRATAATASRSDGPSVVDIIEGTAREMSGTFDHGALVKKASEKFPSHGERIRRGVYNAVITLTKRKTFERTPGGFRLTP